jgi:hypothetical protein
MSTLADRLDRIRADFESQAPDDVKAVMARATEDVRESELMSGIPAVGEPLPEFELPDSDGTPVRSSDLIAAGPLVVTIYRGQW